MASTRGHDLTIEYLAEQGGNVDEVSADGAPVHAAALGGHIAALKVLADNGAVLDCVSPGMYTPLVIATQHKHVAVVRLLADYGVPLDNAVSGTVYLSDDPFTDPGDGPVPSNSVGHIDERGATALFIAAQVGSLELVQLFVEGGARLNHVNGSTAAACTALFIAGQQGHDHIVKYLISQGANVDIPNMMGLTAAWVAAQNGHLAIVRALADAEADLDRGHPDGGSPLYIASQRGLAHMVRLLADRGAR